MPSQSDIYCFLYLFCKSLNFVKVLVTVRDEFLGKILYYFPYPSPAVEEPEVFNWQWKALLPTLTFNFIVVYYENKEMIRWYPFSKP